jgi:dipeptidyl aminopeptidase/acylaminoacyl peptidase
LVVVGSNDYRTPDSEAEQYYEALQLSGIPTALVKVPGANHGGLADRPSQSAAKTSAILAWFQRYRTGQSAQGAAAR